MINLIPMPKKIIINDGYLEKNAVKTLSGSLDERLNKAILKLPVSDNGAELEINVNGAEGEGYILDVGTERITLAAESVAGAFYGIQTLRQLFKEEQIPCCHIEDKPDFAYRGFYHDVTRGKVPTLETLKALVDKMAYCKLNSLQLYVEHTYEFKEYADSIGRTGCLTAEEIRALDDYCYDNFIELIPSLSTFGHLFELLQKDRYKHLRELASYNDEEQFWIGRMLHHTIDPTNPESFELVKSLIDQYMPLFRSDKFNICCDETFDLEIGRHKGMDTGKLYTDFVLKLIEYVQSKGKKVMMWADILLKHPEQVTNLPKDVIFLNWDYAPEPKKSKIAVFAEVDRCQIVCPGTQTWSRLCEALDVSIPNITHMIEYGREYGAQGVLNTNWGDWGNPCSIELAMYSMVYGAEKSWNTEAAEDFDVRINALEYKDSRGAEYLKELAEIQKTAKYSDLVKCYTRHTDKKHCEVEIPEESKLLNARDSALLLCKKLEESKIDNEYRGEMLIAAEGIAVVAELIAKEAGYTFKRLTDTEKWLVKYRRKWLAKNKESELCEIERMFRVMEKA